MEEKAVETNGDAKKIYLGLLQMERICLENRNTKATTQDGRHGGLNRVIAPNPMTGEPEECNQEVDVVQACLTENKAKCLQICRTPH